MPNKTQPVTVCFMCGKVKTTAQLNYTIPPGDHIERCLALRLRLPGVLGCMICSFCKKATCLTLDWSLIEEAVSDLRKKFSKEQVKQK